MSQQDLLDKDLVQLNQKIVLLREAYGFFATIKKKAHTQDDISDAIEELVRPYLSGIKKVEGVLKG